MLDELTARDDAHSAGATEAEKAEIERSLPALHAERLRLRLQRIRRRDTPYADRLVVGFIRIMVIPVAIGIGIVSGWIAYSSSGTLAGIVAGAVGLTVALIAASASVRLARTLFERGARTHRETVARLDLAIRGLDDRIDRAFRVHGLDTRPTR
jgi:hypothetical protein